MDSEPLLNVADYARAARRTLSKEVFDYYEGGALDEITLRENSTGWEKLKPTTVSSRGLGRAI